MENNSQRVVNFTLLVLWAGFKFPEWDAKVGFKVAVCLYLWSLFFPSQPPFFLPDYRLQELLVCVCCLGPILCRLKKNIGFSFDLIQICDWGAGVVCLPKSYFLSFQCKFTSELHKNCECWPVSLFHCQVTMIVMSWRSQLSEFSTFSQGFSRSYDNMCLLLVLKVNVK